MRSVEIDIFQNTEKEMIRRMVLDLDFRVRENLEGTPLINEHGDEIHPHTKQGRVFKDY